jgi:hypothetical protein
VLGARLRFLSGFSLLEAALLIAIIGVLSGGVLQILKHIERSFQHKKTDAHFERILFALGRYMRREGRLPCPCDPSDLVNFGHARRRCQSSAQAYGIVPFITLGLPEAVVRNGRGDFLTYIVHPSMTMMPTLNTQGLKPACAHVPKPLFLVLKDGLAHKAVPDDDPIVLALLSPLPGGAGSFVRGKTARRPHAACKSPCNNLDFKIQVSLKGFGYCQDDMRMETRSNFMSYYARIFCDN